MKGKMMKPLNNRIPAIAYHVGVYLRDELKARGLTQKKFSEMTNIPVVDICSMINGKRGMTARKAILISKALGTSASVWMSLDSQYRIWKENKKMELLSRTLEERRNKLCLK